MPFDMIPFDFEEHAVRVTMRNDEPWFVAADVCRVLEIGNPSDVIARLDEDEKGVDTIDTLGGQQQARIISESGLYAVIFTSRKPVAKRFRKWVTSEVLPSIRRTGRYEDGRAAGTAERYEVPVAEFVGLLTRHLELLEEQNAALRTPPRTRPATVPLREDERLAILSLIAEGVATREIARRTGRSTSVISAMRMALRAPQAEGVA